MPPIVRHLTRALLALAAASIAPLAAARAQRTPTAALDCRPQDVRTLTAVEIGAEWQAYYPDTVRARVQSLLDAGEWTAAMGTAIDRARDLVRKAPAAQIDRYRDELAGLERDFRTLVALPPDRQDRFRADVLRAAHWTLTQNPATGAISLFPDANRIAVTDEVPSSERRALCWPAIAIAGLLTEHAAPARDRTVEILTSLAHRWDSYIDESYSQLPWELALNGLGRSRRTWEPPGHQWVLLHPSLGVEVAGLHRDDLVRVDVAVLEGLGFLKYYKGYSRRLGLTGVATFSSDRPMALGGYVHLWFPQAKVGYVDRPDTTGKHRGSILVSIDLYDLLTGVPTSLKEAKDAALALRKTRK
jgi:hypothetical protein